MKIYTVASGERFEQAARVSKTSFERFGYDYTIFKPEIINSMFTPEQLARNQYYDILYYKFCVAPGLIDDDKIMFVDADTYCQRPLALECMDWSKLNVAPDPASDRNKKQMGRDMDFYFNSGVAMFNRNFAGRLVNEFAPWVRKHIDDEVMRTYGDQTWLNLWCLEVGVPIKQLGYWWNNRNIQFDQRAYIWHPGGRGSVGIEQIQKLEEGL